MTKFNEDGTFTLAHFRPTHRLAVCNHVNSSILFTLANLLKENGSTFLTQYHTSYIESQLSKPNLNNTLGLCVDLDQKDLFTHFPTKGELISIGKFLDLCIPQMVTLMIAHYPVIISSDKKTIDIGCQTISKEKVKEILDALP